MPYHKTRSLTLNGLTLPRVLSFFAGAGMITASVLTIRHFFLANYPATIFTGSFCDISAFFNCDSSAFSSISQVLGIPLGFFGLFMGGLIVLGTIIPSERFEKTNAFLSLFNGIGVIGLFSYSVLYLGSLCLLCTGFYLFSIINFVLFAVYGTTGEDRGFLARFGRPSFRLLVVFALVAGAGAYGFIQYHGARKQAQTGTALTIVKQYFELPKVAWPSTLSPDWVARSTDKFDGAPIQIVEYADFLCPDCLYLAQQLDKLKVEFAGKINIVFQFFPLDKCNTTVAEKAGLHPGACDIATIAAAVDPARFPEIHDEIWANFRAAKNADWRAALAKKYGVANALADPKAQEIVRKAIESGAEYERTSEKFAHGIRSTPTLLINNRMIIGTLPYGHLRAIFQALVEEREGGGRTFIENWVPPAKKRK